MRKAARNPRAVDAHCNVGQRGRGSGLVGLVVPAVLAVLRIVLPLKVGLALGVLLGCLIGWVVAFQKE